MFGLQNEANWSGSVNERGGSFLRNGLIPRKIIGRTHAEPSGSPRTSPKWKVENSLTVTIAG